jgi:transposase
VLPRPPPGRPRDLARLVAAIKPLVEQIKQLDGQIATALHEHPDGEIFLSLSRDPRSVVTAAELLAEIGDCRARLPTPESLACLAGVASSTRQSGKIRSVGFCWSCDKQLHAVTDFAGDSRRANPWAADLYDRALARGHDRPHAVRILARAWIYVIWHCRQDDTAYDPNQHGAFQRLIQSRNHTEA